MKRLVYIALLLLLASCGSHKKTARRTESTPVEVYRKDSDRNGKDAAETVNKYGDKLVAEARRWIGTPYKYGGETRKGTDCSGMIMVIYRDVAGIKIPRNSGKQQEYCALIPKRDLAPGDLVFFTSSKRGHVSHVGMYAGRGRFIHASSSRGVMMNSLDEDYYIRHYHSAGRVPGTAAKGKREKMEKEIPEELPAPRPFRFEAVDNTPGRSGVGGSGQNSTPRPRPVVVTETIRVVEVRVDTVYVPVPAEPDSIASEVNRAF